MSLSTQPHALLDPDTTRKSYGSIQTIDRETNSDDESVVQADPAGALKILHRELSSRQVQMIAIGGTIGTGLFLGTGKSLAEGGPGSILICYGLVGFIVYVTLLLLGEMGTQYPVAGSFTTYAARFFSPSYAFALSWNYWLNDAVSVASDLTAAQLVLHFWTEWHPWVFSLIILTFLLLVNALNVRSYGEMEYILSSLKVITIIAFIIIGVFVNVGVNREHSLIGFSNWFIKDAPFVNGLHGFARVFVTASFAYGGTESLGITAGETRNPSKNMPRIVRFVFWRILLFYVLSIIVIGLNVPYDYPNLSNRSTTSSPFTIVFFQAGSNIAASFMNTVILSSVLSAGNHALFAGTRILYGLSIASPPLAPRIFSRTNDRGVPFLALLASSSISGLCFGSSYIGSGVLWGWLQNVVGVSNQIAWLSIGLASLRFRKAWMTQNRPLQEMKFRASWTWPWGPQFVVVTVSLLILFQGWSSIFPSFSPVDFISFYLEILAMAVMYLIWIFFHPSEKQAREPTEHTQTTSDVHSRKLDNIMRLATKFNDVVDIKTVDLYKDEHMDDDWDREDDLERGLNLQSRWKLAWRFWYLFS